MGIDDIYLHLNYQLGFVLNTAFSSFNRFFVFPVFEPLAVASRSSQSTSASKNASLGHTTLRHFRTSNRAFKADMEWYFMRNAMQTVACGE